jgi:uncharacterized protein YjiS (DUF1127 family)
LHRGARKPSDVAQAAKPLPNSVCVNGIASRCRCQQEKKMTTISDHAAQPAISGVWRGFARWIGMWPRALAAYWDRRAAIKTLHQLDDRALRDIGIVRSHIEAAVGGALNPGMARFRQ